MQALKIVDETYALYLSLPLDEHRPLVDVNRHFIVFDPNLPGGSGIFDELDFRRYYYFETSPISTHKLTEVKKHKHRIDFYGDSTVLHPTT